MRWRNQILALLCLTIFFALGVLYFRHWVVQKPFGIVLFIGEGLTPDRIAATRIYAGGTDRKLALETLPAMAMLSNYSLDFAVPDEAAAAAALATGEKINNRTGADGSRRAVKTIIDLAREKGRSIGLVTNARLTNQTIAAFYAAGEGNADDVARRFADRKQIDLALGGGGTDFLPETKGGGRHDSRDLILELRRDGFEIVRTKAELENMPAWRRPRILGLFSGGEMAFANQVATVGEQPSLPDMTRRAIELLEWNPGGYLLIVDAGLMGIAAQKNRGEATLSESVELDRAVAVANSFAGDNSTILVAGNLGIGGLALNGSPFRRDRGIAILGVNAGGDPSLTWSTGPNGPRTQTERPPPPAAESHSAREPGAHIDVINQEPAASFAEVARSNVADVLAAGRGPGSERLHGFLDNTVFFQIIRDEL